MEKKAKLVFGLGIKGEKYPCKPDIFEMTYEVAE